MYNGEWIAVYIDLDYAISIEQRFYIIYGAPAMYNADFDYWTKLDWRQYASCNVVPHP